MSEAIYRKKRCRELRRIGAMIIPYVASTRGMSGTPDIYLSHKKWRGWLEFKGERTVVRPIQQQVMLQMWATRTKVYVVREGNILESHLGERISEFRDAMDLLNKLQELGYET